MINETLMDFDKQFLNTLLCYKDRIIHDYVEQHKNVRYINIYAKISLYIRGELKISDDPEFRDFVMKYHNSSMSADLIIDDELEDILTNFCSSDKIRFIRQYIRTYLRVPIRDHTYIPIVIYDDPSLEYLDILTVKVKLESVENGRRKYRVSLLEEEK